MDAGETIVLALTDVEAPRRQVAGPALRKCKYCERKFTKAEHLKRHQRTRESSAYPTIRGKSWTLSLTLRHRYWGKALCLCHL